MGSRFGMHRTMAKAIGVDNLSDQLPRQDDVEAFCTDLGTGRVLQSRRRAGDDLLLARDRCREQHFRVRGQAGTRRSRSRVAPAAASRDDRDRHDRARRRARQVQQRQPARSVSPARIPGGVVLQNTGGTFTQEQG
jgi:hypothetical protein